MNEWARSTFAALESPPYRVFWLGTFLSLLGFFTSTVVQSVVALELAETNRAVGLTSLGQGIAMLSLGPIGGALADRVSKRGLLFGSQLVGASIFAAMAWLIHSDRLALPILVASAFGLGACISVMGPARQAYVPELVASARVGNAIALNQVALNATRIGGPALAGLLLTARAFGASAAYSAMSALFGLSLITLLALPNAPPSERARAGLLREVATGLSYVADTPRLRRRIAYFFLVIMLGFPYVTILPGLVNNTLGRDTEAVSWLFAISAAGGLTSSISVARFADSERAQAIYSALALLFGVSLMLTACAPTLPTAALGMLGVGVGAGGFQTLNGAVVLRETEPAYYGRVMSLTLLAFGAFGIMGFPLGALADLVGERTTLGVMGVAVCSISLCFNVIFRSEARQLAEP